MKIVNIREAKTHLSRLIEAAVLGESFVIAKAGKPLVQVTPVGNQPAPRGKLGFLVGEVNTPDDFDRMGVAEIMGTAEVKDLFRGRP